MPAVLEERFRTLSRQFHPDYFYNATPAERRASLERSSYLNDAYRTLRQPAARIEYLLKLEGLAPKNPEEASRQVPPALLEEVFALNEELDEIRDLRGNGGAAGGRGAPASSARGNRSRPSASTTKRSSRTWRRAGTPARARATAARFSKRCATGSSSATTSRTCWRASNGSSIRERLDTKDMRTQRCSYKLCVLVFCVLI